MVEKKGNGCGEMREARREIHGGLRWRVTFCKGGEKSRRNSQVGRNKSL